MSASPVTTPGLTVAGSVAVAALREVAAGRAAGLGLVNALALAASARIAGRVKGIGASARNSLSARPAWETIVEGCIAHATIGRKVD